MIKVIPVYGRVELRSWIELAPNGQWIGMGQAVHKDENGNVTRIVTEPTGLELRAQA